MDTEKLTLQDVKLLVETIRDISDDNEAAHLEEDKLHQGLLRAIAQGAVDDPAACAAEALKTLEMSFTRWYA